MHTSIKQHLKAQAHHLKPIVLLGAKGLTDAVLAETDAALLAHELIKIKINGSERDDRIEIANQLSRQMQAELIQMIGNTIILYRKNEEKIP